MFKKNLLGASALGKCISFAAQIKPDDLYIKKIERPNCFSELSELERWARTMLEFQHPNPWELLNQSITAAFEFGDRSNWLDDVPVVAINRLA